MNKESHSSMPPNILLLDLDETLGSFGILFSLFTVLRRIPLYSGIMPNMLVKPLLKLLIHDEIFRPGIEGFVKFIVSLKKEKYIDYIFINTNQSLPNDPSNKWSVPIFIVECLHTIAGEEFIDRIYTRDTSGRILINNEYVATAEIPKKEINRVMNDFSTKESISNITFVDNMPELILHESIPLITTPYNFIVYCIESYNLKIEYSGCILDYILLINSVVFNTINTMYEIECESIEPIENIIKLVWNQYLTRCPKKTSYENYELLYLHGYLYQKYKTVRLNAKPLLDKADKYTLTNEQCRDFWRKPSEN